MSQFIVAEGIKPLIIVSNRECKLGKKIKLEDNDKIPLPVYLSPLDKIPVPDPVTGGTARTYVLRKLEYDGVPYITRDLDIADYIVENKNTEKKFVIKRMSMQTILEMWANKRIGNYYQGKRGFDAMMRDLRREFSADIPVILAIEDYNATFFDTTSNVIWTSWKVKYSNKSDARGRPIYSMANFKRHNIHPYTFRKTMEAIKRKYGIIVKHFYDGRGLYSYIVNDLVFARDYDEIISEFSAADEKTEILRSIIPFIDEDTAKRWIDAYGSVYKVLSKLAEGSNTTLFEGTDLNPHDLEGWRKLIFGE